MTYRTPQRDLLKPTARWWHRFRISTQKFAFLTTAAAFASVFGYVLLTNSTATQGFSIEDLQQEIAAVREQNEKLELRAADLRALTSLHETGVALQLEPADSFEYMSPNGGAVARNP